ncbi:MAG: CvpA family protein [Pseudomonadales bacterium]|jgi:membrane protein required for colicin V production
MMGFELVDWIIFTVLILSSLIGMVRGFVTEALSLATWLAAMIVSRLFATQVSTLLVPYIDEPSLRLGAAYVILVFGTLIVGGLINRLVGELIRLSGLGATDKFLGILFGFGRGLIVILLLVAGFHYLADIESQSWWKDSRLIPHFVSLVEWLGPVLWEQGGELLESVSMES